jgi:hypothetical protein
MSMGARCTVARLSQNAMSPSFHLKRTVYSGGRAGPGPGYEERRYGEPGYGERRHGEEVRERCFGLRRESDELRSRMEREFNPMERARTEGRLHEVRDQEERMGCHR